MAKPTPHSALEGMGFKLVGSGFNGSSDRVGTAMTHHYTMTRNTVGKKNSLDNIVRPITHHVFVDEFSKNPGKYNVSYHVTQDGKPYAEGDFDTLRRHKDNMHRGSNDPIKDIMEHHQGIGGVFKREQAPPQEDVDESTLHRLVPGPYHMTPGWGEDDPNMKGTRYLRPGPEYPMVHLNAAQEWPLDAYVHRRLTGGRHGYPKFEYEGRFPGDKGIDVYHASYPDPEDPGTSKYGFTVRHRPGTERPFSYNATQSEVDPESGEDHIARFLDISNMGDPVLNFSQLGAVIERHHNVLRSLGLLKPRPTPPKPVYTAAYLQHCPMCGSTDVDWIEDYEQDAHGLHSIPIGKYHGQCNGCFDEFKPGEETVTLPNENDPLYQQYMAPAHYREASARSILERADEDLRP